MVLEREPPACSPSRSQLTPLQLSHKVSVLRAALKLVAATAVKVALVELSHERRKHLLDDDEYWYKLDSVSPHILSAMTTAHPVQNVLERRSGKNSPVSEPHTSDDPT